MRNLTRITTLIIATFFISEFSFAQCESWVDSPNKEDASNAHVIYRDAYKAKDFTAAYEPWLKAYTLAPAADGKRASHFIDGIEIHRAFLKESTDEAKKKEYKETIVRLYDEAINCFENGGIKTKDDAATRIAQLKGRKGYDMYYTINSLYSDNLKVLEESVATLGNKSEYVVLMPLAAIAVYQFENGKMDANKAREIHATLNAIGEANSADERLGSYYEDALKNANASYQKIEREIFDCAYFKGKWEPNYRAEPGPQAAKDLYNQLKLQGCDDTDAFVLELKKEYESWASGVNASRKAEYEANNPGILASKAYKAGDYSTAVAKYREAIQGETDANKKAGYHNSIASILFRKLKKYNDARKEANKALALRPGWGKPIMMIGDMYATSARSCGDSWNQRLAVLAAIDKYNQAKADPDFATEAAGKAAKYRASMPEKAEGHMRSVKAGQTATVGCWIGEKVKIRFK